MEKAEIIKNKLKAEQSLTSLSSGFNSKQTTQRCIRFQQNSKLNSNAVHAQGNFFKKSSKEEKVRIPEFSKFFSRNNADCLVSNKKELQKSVSFDKQDEQACRKTLKNAQRSGANKTHKNNAQANNPHKIKKTRSDTIYDDNNLKNVLSQFRIQNLISRFLSQVRKNSIHRKPVDYQPFQIKNNDTSILFGFEPPRSLIIIAYVIGILDTLVQCFLSSLVLVFHYEMFFFKDYFDIVSLVLLVIEMVLGFVLVIESQGTKITKIKEISIMYIKSSFIFDFLCLIALGMELSSESQFSHYLPLLFFTKMPSRIKNLTKAQRRLVRSFFLQQYWGLIKILLTNFTLAHFIAIFLIMMSWLDQNQNWMHTKQIKHKQWYQQYCWSYYWGTTIMLTVGFGDIAATNYKEAFCLIFIETLSCLALAYNINCIGGLLKQIKIKQLEKEKGLKVLKQICEKNGINEDLDSKLTHHVKQIHNIQSKFNFETENKFIKSLPDSLRQELLRFSNQNVLCHVKILKNFTNRTIMELAEKIQTKIAHPDEILCRFNESCKLILLKQGKIGFMPNYRFEKYQKFVIDRLTVKQRQQSRLISLDFVKHPKTKNYDIKSLTYSMIYFMETEDLIDIIRKKDIDFENYFILRHKEANNLQQFEVVQCAQCSQSHSKFTCPRLHFMPISQHVINRELNSIKKSAIKKRMPFRRHTKRITAYEAYLKCRLERTSYNLASANSQILTSYDRISSKCSTIQLNNPLDIVFNTRRQLQQLSQLQASNFNINHKNLQKDPKTNKLLQILQQMKVQMQAIVTTQENAGQNFWDVDSDAIHDYKFYFCEGNSRCLQEIRLKKVQRVRSLHQSGKNKAVGTFMDAVVEY